MPTIRENEIINMIDKMFLKSLDPREYSGVPYLEINFLTKVNLEIYRSKYYHLFYDAEGKVVF